MGAKVDLVGETFRRLLVLEDIGRKHGKILWKCVCSCGNTVNVTGNALRRENTKSCGCLNKEAITTHGLAKHVLYKVWGKMHSRCYKEKAKDYSAYGGRGISICKEWYSLQTFYKWAIANGWEKTLQIDRKDNDGNYTPDNCRFVTRIVNINNRRILSNNSTGYTGVCFHKVEHKYQASLYHKGKRHYMGNHIKIQDAIAARNIFITRHNLPHKIQRWVDEGIDLTK